jgi:D-amino-acid dehydrogenase
MFDKEAPLLFRPQMDWQQWRWGLQFLAQCNDAAFERNVAQIVALGAYSHAALKDLVKTTGIEYNRLERGIAHFYTDQKSFDAAGHAVELMRKHGVQRRLVSRDELLQIEPAFKAYGDKITGGTYTSTDESGDARVFTQELARRCAARGVQFLYGHDVLRLNKIGNAIDSVAVMPNSTSASGKKRLHIEGGRHRGGLRLVQRTAAAQRGRGPADLPGQGLQRHFQDQEARARALREHHRRRSEVRDQPPRR